MRKLPSHLALWWVGWLLVSAGMGWVSTKFGSHVLHAWVLGSLAILFILIETLFWKLIDGMKGVVTAERFTGRQAIDLGRTFQIQRRVLVREYLVSLFLRVTVAFIAFVLASEKLSNVIDVWMLELLRPAGYFLLFVALPLLPHFLFTYIDLSNLVTRADVSTTLRKQGETLRKDLRETKC